MESYDLAYRTLAGILATGYAVILVWAIYRIDRDNPPRNR